MALKIVNQGIAVHSAHGTDRQSCAFPQIAVLPTGRWICGFRASRTKSGSEGQHSALAVSDDAGASWSEPISPFTAPAVEGGAGQFRSVAFTSLGGTDVLATLYWVDHSDPALPFYNETTQGLLDSRIYLARSSDGGMGWTVPVSVDTSPYHLPTPITGPVLLLPDGQWACQFELNKHYYDTTPWHHAAILKFSADQGRTWPDHVVAAQDPENRIFYWDQRPQVMADGSILNYFWTYDTATGTYLDIRGRRSADSGRTWSEMWDIGLPGQPARPVPLPGGRVGLIYVDRTGSPLIKMRVSTDGGRSFPAATELVLYDSALSAQMRNRATMQDAWSDMFKFSVGLPAPAVLPGGDVLVVYYAGPEPDTTDIRWVRVAPER